MASIIFDNGRGAEAIFDLTDHQLARICNIAADRLRHIQALEGASFPDSDKAIIEVALTIESLLSMAEVRRNMPKPK